MHMEKTHQAIIQGRKDQAQRAARQGWDRALHKDPALLEHQQGQAVIKYNTDFLMIGFRKPVILAIRCFRGA